jgi:hypothetical protein
VAWRGADERSHQLSPQHGNGEIRRARYQVSRKKAPNSSSAPRAKFFLQVFCSFTAAPWRNGDPSLIKAPRDRPGPSPRPLAWTSHTCAFTRCHLRSSATLATTGIQLKVSLTTTRVAFSGGRWVPGDSGGFRGRRLPSCDAALSHELVIILRNAKIDKVEKRDASASAEGGGFFP